MTITSGFGVFRDPSTLLEHQQYYGSISVKDPRFGARGNGVTDDTTAIQNAINATPQGSTLIFPIGTYVISSSLTISNTINIIGSQGQTKSGSYTFYGTKLVPASAALQSSMTALITNNARSTISGLAIVGTGTGNGGQGILYGSGSHESILQKCGITGFGVGVALGSGSDHIMFEDVNLEGNNYGAEFQSGNLFDYSFTRCWFDGCVTAALHLVANTSTENITLIRCHLGYSPYGILQDNTTTGDGFNSVTLIDTPIEHISSYHMYLYNAGNIRIFGGYWNWNGIPANAALYVKQLNFGPIWFQAHLDTPTNASATAVIQVGSYSNYNIYCEGSLNSWATAWFTGNINPPNRWLNGKPFADAQAIGSDNVSVSTASTDTSIVTLKPSVNATNFSAKAYLHVTTACTVTLKFAWNDGTGLQTYYWYNAQALAIGSYPLPQIFVNAYTFNNMSVIANASVASAITVSAGIQPEM